MATLYSSSSSSSSYTLLSPLKNTPKHSTFLKRSLNFKRTHPVVHSLLSQQEADTSPALRTFWKWLSDEGVISPKCPVKPGVVPEGLGLVATKDIGRNEVVLEVPKKYWINPDTVAASEIGGVCNGLKPWISVALFLIREKKKGDESFWRYYFDILPEETDSTIYWSEEELSEIQGTQLLSTTLGVKEYVQTEFEKLEKEVILPHKELFPSPITIEDFQWAFGMCRSRAYSRLRGQSLVLVPLADLINHSQNITTEEYAWEIRGGGLFSTQTVFSLRNPVSVKAGGQVMVQYDINKSNADLALDYGFIESRPERNAYTLTLQISEADMFFGDKLDIAESNGLSENEYFDITLGNPIPPAMLPYLRLVALSGTDAFLLESIFRNSIWDHLQLPVSRSNEQRICQVIREACNSVLASYPTTIEEDEKLLESGNLDSRLHIAVGVRVGEKKVLQQIEGIFKERELELDVLEYYQERRLKDLGLVGEQGDIIFWEPK